ncbi:MAG: ABC transporter permease [Candidatus Eisenbacteria bacterium]|uniref:ABC transporter permease n=1 Tax=Eiseniibacteriota bacterium TaxID=2212470 RepID=A0A538T4X8_UNCEI|nr:MAG: ABC transporter permease [Candidatus Eisenbacteria bacterium]
MANGIRLPGFLREFGIPRLLIAVFLVVLFAVAVATHMDLRGLISDSIVRVGRNGILVLALLPAIQGGIGLNFGLPIGIICGLVGGVISLNAGVHGIAGVAMAAGIGVALAIPAGAGYGWLLNRTRGQEMMVGTYLGFAIVSMMSVFWLLAPFQNPTLVWAIGGRGLRTTLSLGGIYDKVLDRWLTFTVSGVRIPGGTLVVFGALCLFVWLFFRTRMGITIAAARSSTRFARAAGISDERTRVQATVLSTVLAAIGIVVFSQSYGFVQLYTAPLLMAFPAIACILIGGASVTRATIGHVIVGTFLFQSILTVALPVTSQVIEGDISETARLIIQNGMILYALTRIGRT